MNAIDTIGRTELEALIAQGWRAWGGCIECANCYFTSVERGGEIQPVYLSKDPKEWAEPVPEPGQELALLL